jgi:methanethiol S-methyltransferase
MDSNARWKLKLSRGVGITFGAVTQLAFAMTVPLLFVFLRFGSGRHAGSWLALDSLLAIQFAVIHSLLLLPSTRSHLTRWMPNQLFGSLFAISTCLGLWLMFAYWRESTHVVWRLSGWGRILVSGGFYASWVALFYSLSLTGFGYQTGFTQWMFWLRRQPLPRREFSERGAYRWLRHPVYLSFLGLIWFTPRMTADHALLTAVWTVYIFVGSYLKDGRLASYLGDSYRQYASRVPGYPGIAFGPLGKWRAIQASSDTIVGSQIAENKAA